MSSIKIDVKKKAPPRPEDGDSFSRSSPLYIRYSEEVGLVVQVPVAAFPVCPPG